MATFCCFTVGEKHSPEFYADTARFVVNDAMQSIGGIGYTSIYPMLRLMRDVHLITLWTGTNNMVNLIIE